MVILSFILIILAVYYFAKKWFQRQRYLSKVGKSYTTTVAFFHPYCNAGGGGERVLWAAIRSIQTKYAHVHCIVYTGDLDATKDEIVKKASNRFNIKLSRDIDLVYLKTRWIVEAQYYPYFTLLMQSLGSVVLGAEALFKFSPDIYIDTMGYAFTLFLFKNIASCKTACYTHYPTISTDMLEVVQQQRVGVNNRAFITNSYFLSSLKMLYYKAFALLYGFMGRRSDIVIVNSSWTKGHINELWKIPNKTFLVYPPCDVQEFRNITLDNKNDRILSIAQFRPEKEHVLQIKAFHQLHKKLDQQKQIPTLVLVGSCRNDEDAKRVENLKLLCSKLQLTGHVLFKINLTFEELLIEMKAAGIGLHTMTNEHFGIGVVECMSAGLIMIAHDSGGPKLDIVIEHNGHKTGFLADSVESYANVMETVINMSPEEQNNIRRNARLSVERFSDSTFSESFLAVTKDLFS